MEGRKEIGVGEGEGKEGRRRRGRLSEGKDGRKEEQGRG